jgi:hypothetical protein
MSRESCSTESISRNKIAWMYQSKPRSITVERQSYYTSQRYLDQLPSPALLLDLHTPLFIQTNSSSVDDSSSQYRSLSRR